MKRAAIIAGVALLVVIVARMAHASAADPRNTSNWNYLPGYRPGSGAWA